MDADKIWNSITTICIMILLYMLYERFLTEQTSLVKTLHTAIMMCATAIMFLRIMGVMLLLITVKNSFLENPASVFYTIFGIFIGAMSLGAIVLSLC